ncbi:hypothetical protein Bbelb_212560 [Branchiostoma belcheri]|nr:hypothetical protein Bbelb_212560 [Branchiostoma belcheri]
MQRTQRTARQGGTIRIGCYSAIAHSSSANDEISSGDALNVSGDEASCRRSCCSSLHCVCKTSSRIGQAGVSAGHDLALAAAAESDSSPSDTYKRWLNAAGVLRTGGKPFGGNLSLSIQPYRRATPRSR